MSFSKKEKLFAALILYVCGLKLNQVAKYIGNFKSVSHFADLKIVLTLSLTNISSCCLSCLISEMKGKEIDTVASQAVSIVTATLQLVLLLEDWRPSCLRHVSMTSRIARIMCVFLTGKKKGQPANADVLPVVFVFFFSRSRVLHNMDLLRARLQKLVLVISLFCAATHAIKVSSRFLTIQNVLTQKKKKVKSVQRSNDKRYESTFCIN